MEKSRKKITKLVIASVAAIILCVSVIYFVSCFLTANAVLHPTRKDLSYMWIIDRLEDADLKCDAFSVETENGRSLRGWWIPAQTKTNDEWKINDSESTVIFSHNYESNREGNEIGGVKIAKYLAHAGYNVVMFDYLGCGTSDDGVYTFGVRETGQLNAIAGYVAAEKEQRNIALMGWGFGAASAINCGCCNENVKAIIADSPYSDLDAYFNRDLHVWTGINDAFSMSVTRFFMNKIANCDFADSNPLKSVNQAKNKAFLFIHGDSDTVFPYSNSRVLYNSAVQNNDADIEIYPSTLHLYSFMSHEEAYMNRVIGFLDDKLGK